MITGDIQIKSMETELTDNIRKKRSGNSLGPNQSPPTPLDNFSDSGNFYPDHGNSDLQQYLSFPLCF